MSTITVRLIHKAGHTSIIHIRRYGDYPVVIMYGGICFMRLQVFEPGENHDPHEYKECSCHFIGITDTLGGIVG